MKIYRILLAGTKSGAGKTTVTCGILQALINRGQRVTSYKCGPDYIDPMFHGKVIGIKSGNLDSFFTDEKALIQLLCTNSQEADISVMEGVMGYYDGLGFTDTASTYSLAAMTKTPVILVVDAKGMSSSLGAIIKGFLTFKEESYIRGVIFNRLPERLYPEAEKLAESLGVKPLGYVPDLPECSIESRHLGLVTAEEIEDLKSKIDRLAERLKDTIDFEGIVSLAEQAPPLIAETPDTDKKIEGVTIGVAEDEAFCFLYRDNLELLKEMGAKLVSFSPLRDKTLPEGINGLLLCGGYPELYTQELSQNVSMRNSIKAAIDKGMPAIAECGGFMYLHERLEDINGKEYPMAGVISGRCYKTPRLQRFGYISLKAAKDSLIAGKQEVIKAHEFHYWDSENSGECFHAEKPGGLREWDCIHASESLYAGFPHLYFYAKPAIADRFLNKCTEYGKRAVNRTNAEEKVSLNALEEVLKDTSRNAVTSLDQTAGKHAFARDVKNSGISPINPSARAASKKHWDSIAKPIGSLGLFEDIIIQIAGIQGSAQVDIRKKAVVIMCSDNGVVQEQVTQTDSSVTAIVTENFARGIASINRMAMVTGADVIPVDMGVAADLTAGKILNKKISYGTENIAKGPAMTIAQTHNAIETGIGIVKQLKEAGYGIIGTGEMGIGNTTTSSAVASVLLRLPVEEVTGRGAGLSGEGLNRKINVIKESIRINRPDPADPIDVLSKLGGYDIAGMTGLYLGGMRYGLPIVIDGVISSVAAFLAAKIDNGAINYMIPSHLSKEPASSRIMQELGLNPVIHGNLALGEGTGTALLFPLLDTVLKVYDFHSTFDDIQVKAYESFETIKY